ncbi:hypothetical protein ACLSU7_15170 [Bdellovibrio sp. HCB185ZH]|uniref:hypothetical protein n=1 Tax=Bdellovibrio sp. HCB185ZH TaxID=3394235 RepID=UPI0039A7290C
MTRIQRLSTVIAEQFEQMMPSDLDEEAAHFEYFMLDMYQIAKIEKTHVELMHLFNDKVLSPVFIDHKLKSLLHRYDTFLIGVGLKGAGWHVLFMSPPYHAGNV